MRKLFVLLLLCALLPLVGSAQSRYPVVVSGLGAQPRIFISDYLIAGSGNIRAGLMLTDLSETSREVYLQLRLESSNVELVSLINPPRPYTPIRLDPGNLVSLSDIDFAEYLDLANLQLQGISRQTLASSGRLSEGQYTLSITVIDAVTHKPVSNVATYPLKLELNPQPLLNLPRNGVVLPCSDLQYINFAWQVNSVHVNATNTSYVLAMYEVAPEATNPEVAIHNGQAFLIYRSEPMSGTNMLYGVAEPLLECGKRYVYTVTASSHDGRDVFQNKGESMPGWFYYGYPNNGVVPLEYPIDNGFLAISSRKVLRWGGTSKLLPNQPVRYAYKVVEVEPTDNAAQSMGLPAFVEYPGREGQDHMGGAAELSGLSPSQRYAWQVTAYTGMQQVGQSPVYTFYGAPLVEVFYAGNHMLTVVEAEGSLEHFSGKAEVTIDASGRTGIVSFKDIQLDLTNGLYQLRGSFTTVAPQAIGNITLEAIVERNGRATFYPDSLRVGQDGLSLHGYIDWVYPFATTDGKQHKVRTKPCWANFNALTLKAEAYLEADHAFDLLEPYGYGMVLDAKSRFIVNNNRYGQWFAGHITAPAMVKGAAEPEYKLYFNSIEQLFYNTISDYQCTNKVLPLSNSDLRVHPSEFTIDLDDSQSPGLLADNTSWTGMYYNQFWVDYSTTMDQMRQLIPIAEINHHYTDSPSTHAYLDAGGLSMQITDTDFGTEESIWFNTFAANITEVDIDVQDNKVKGGHLKGSLVLPLISQTQRYAYTVPVSTLGWQVGYLDQALERTTFEHNPEGGQQHLTVTINRAVFANRSSLILDVDIHSAFLGLTFKGLQGLTLWGRQYEVGFATPNGTIALTQQLPTMLNGFETTFDHVAAGRNGNLYAIGLSGKMNMGEDVTGAEGPPIVNIYSVDENSLLTGSPNSAGPSYENTPLPQGGGGSLPDPGDVGKAPEGGTAVDLSSVGFAQQNDAMDALLAVSQEVATIRLPVDSSELSLFDTRPSKAAAQPESDSQKYTDLVAQFNAYADALLFITSYLEGPEVREIERKVKDIKDALGSVDANRADELIANATSLSKFKTYILKLLVDEMVKQLKKPIEEQELKLQMLVANQMGDLSEKAMEPARAAMNKAFDQVKPSVMQGVLALSAGLKIDTGLIAPKVGKLIDASKYSIVKNIDEAVKSAVDTEITGPINGFIHETLAGTLYDMIDSMVTKNMYMLAEGTKPNGANMKADMNLIVKQAGEEAKAFISVDHMGKMLENTANAVWNNISTKKIIDDMVEKLTGSGLEQYANDLLTNAATEQVEKLFGESAGKFAGGLAASVHLDPGAILKGDYKKAITFDPSAIVLITPVADISGYVRFVEDDPVWGKSWQAMLNAKVKIPKPFLAYVKYINGNKARPDSSTFKYWIIDMGASGLNVALSPVPLVLDAAKGKAYQYVKRDPETNTYAPNETTRFGINLDATFFDASGGATAFLDIGLGATIMDQGFILEMYGKVDAANQISKDKDGIPSVGRSLITGKGLFTYNSIDGAFIGKSTVTTNTNPLLCAGGAMNMAITKDSFYLALGTRDIPIMVDVLCRNKPQLKGWFAMSDKGLDMGAELNIDVRLETGWIGSKAARINPWFRYKYGLGFNTIIYWSPFKIAEAELFVDFCAGLGVQYDFTFSSGNLTIAEVGLGGRLKYVADPQSVISGNLYGRIKVLNVGFSVDFDMELKL